MAALTQKNGYYNELILSLKTRFREYIRSDRFEFNHIEKDEYEKKLAKQVNITNIVEFSKFPNNLVKQHIDGKINII